MVKRGLALVMVMIVIVVLTVLFASLFSSAINENRLVRRYENTSRAFWLAETGVAQAAYDLPNNVSGTLGGSQNQYAATTTSLGGGYYQIDSTGSIVIPAYGTISKVLTAIVRTSPVDPSHFQHAIRTTSELEVHGNVTINGPQEQFASLNFANLFDHSKQEVKDHATHLYVDPPNNVTPVDGITWVTLSPGQELKITSDTWTGSGLLVVEGDVQITGGTFYGIIYVIGKLRMAGNKDQNGSILAESGADIDTELTGTVDITYDAAAISAALGPLGFFSPVIVSWKEN